MKIAGVVLVHIVVLLGLLVSPWAGAGQEVVVYSTHFSSTAPDNLSPEVQPLYQRWPLWRERGQRVCSCFRLQSVVREDSDRELLLDLDESIQALRPEHAANHPQVTRLVGIYHNLLRKWVGK